MAPESCSYWHVLRRQDISQTVNGWAVSCRVAGWVPTDVKKGTRFCRNLCCYASKYTRIHISWLESSETLLWKSHTQSSVSFRTDPKKRMCSGITSVYPLFRKLRNEIKHKKIWNLRKDDCSVSPKVSGLLSNAKGETQPTNGWSHNFQYNSKYRGPNPAAARPRGAGLRSFACLDCRFESRRRQGCLSLVSVVCFYVEVSATGWSLVQRSPIECGVPECNHETQTKKRPGRTRVIEPWKKKAEEF